MLNTMEVILKIDWNFCTIVFFFSTMEVNGAKQLFGSNHSAKYIPVFSRRKKLIHDLKYVISQASKEAYNELNFNK